MPRYRIVHNTQYLFSENSTQCTGSVVLTPRDSSRQHVAFHQIVFRPSVRPKQLTDRYGNLLTQFAASGSLQVLEICAISTVSTRDHENKIPAALAEPGELAPFLASSPRIALHGQFARYAAPAPRAPVVTAQSLCEKLYRDFSYDAQAARVEATAVDAFNRKRGVCQDFAHVAIACLRSSGIAARYVSGYLDMQGGAAQRRIGGDMSHAWISVYSPHEGWIDLDPTHNRRADARYVTLAYGRDYSDVAPVSGHVTGGGGQRMKVSVDIELLRDDYHDR